MSQSVEQAVKHEIESLHEFFVGWFTGELPAERFDELFLHRMDEEMILIPPAGMVLNLQALSEMLRQSHGNNPAFRIAIRNVTVRRVWPDHVLATYEEWQRNALASEPADNGRISTVLFRRGDALSWLHLQETWLPAEVMAAGPYDF
ncbi:hypothetical protein [Elongatibacter sediminis]|uniref:DUF4440 domain-containing protein n=1 Tax=Elongatibacter sediminis TaxID=3119006 RepID=A0AAW9R540_9GAMM